MTQLRPIRRIEWVRTHVFYPRNSHFMRDYTVLRTSCTYVDLYGYVHKLRRKRLLRRGHESHNFSAPALVTTTEFVSNNNIATMTCFNLLDLTIFRAAYGCNNLDKEQADIDSRVYRYYDQSKTFPGVRAKTLHDYSAVFDDAKQTFRSRSEDECWATDSICESRDDGNTEEDDSRQ